MHTMCIFPPRQCIAGKLIRKFTKIFNNNLLHQTTISSPKAQLRNFSLMRLRHLILSHGICCV
jgi:hypothetical protein